MPWGSSRAGIRKEPSDGDVRRREEMEPVVRWWAKLPGETRLRIIRSQHSGESASAASAILRAFYLSGVAVSTEEVAAELGWSEERVKLERWTALQKVARAYRRAQREVA